MGDGPVRLFRRSFDERLAAAGLAASVALGVLLNLVDWAGPGEAVLVALTGATLTFAVGAGLRAERRAELGGMVEAVPLVRTEMERALALAGEIAARYPGRAPAEELQRRCRRFVDDLEGLAEGRIRLPGEDGSELVERTKRCVREMRAVTNVAAFGPSWWRSPVGQAYWRANVEALGRGVRITRIFVVDGQPGPQLRELITAQAAAGVRVLAVDRASAGRDLLLNFVVWDDDQAWQAEMDPYGAISSHIFHHDPRTIGRLRALADSSESRALG